MFEMNWGDAAKKVLGIMLFLLGIYLLAIGMQKIEGSVRGDGEQEVCKP